MSPSAVHESSNASLDARTDVFKKANSDESAIAVGAQTKDGRSAVPTYPKFVTKEEERLYCKQHLACAFRVFAARGYDEGVAGHMSLRDPVNPKHFWINPLVLVETIITLLGRTNTYPGDQQLHHALRGH